MIPTEADNKQSYTIEDFIKWFLRDKTVMHLAAPQEAISTQSPALASSVEENTPIRTPDIPIYEGKTGTVREGDEDQGLAARMVFPFPM